MSRATGSGLWNHRTLLSISPSPPVSTRYGQPLRGSDDECGDEQTARRPWRCRFFARSQAPVPSRSPAHIPKRTDRDARVWGGKATQGKHQRNEISASVPMLIDLRRHMVGLCRVVPAIIDSSSGFPSRRRRPSRPANLRVQISVPSVHADCVTQIAEDFDHAGSRTQSTPNIP